MVVALQNLNVIRGLGLATINLLTKFEVCILPVRRYDKNSSEDEIANVNFLRRYRTRTSKLQKILRLTN